MINLIEGKAWIFGDNIDTDQIYPGRYLELTEPDKIAAHAMEGVDPNFSKDFKAGGILVAGDNFGCGSSREHAVITLKESGVSAVIANSFARIFYRNAINLGFPALICKDAHLKIKKGDRVTIDLSAGTVTDVESGEAFQGEKLSDHVMKIIENGGVIPMIKARISSTRS